MENPGGGRYQPSDRKGKRSSRSGSTWKADGGNEEWWDGKREELSGAS